MKSLCWSFLLFNHFIFMQGVRFQLRCVFWPSWLRHFRWLSTFQRSVLAPSSDVPSKQYPTLTLYRVMTEDRKMNFHCTCSTKNIMMSRGCTWKSRWMSGRKNPEVYLLIISDAEFFDMVYLTAVRFLPSGSGQYTFTKIGKRQHWRRNNTQTQNTQNRKQKQT